MSGGEAARFRPRCAEGGNAAGSRGVTRSEASSSWVGGLGPRYRLDHGRPARPGVRAARSLGPFRGRRGQHAVGGDAGVLVLAAVVGLALLPLCSVCITWTRLSRRHFARAAAWWRNAVTSKSSVYCFPSCLGGVRLQATRGRVRGAPCRTVPLRGVPGQPAERRGERVQGGLARPGGGASLLRRCRRRKCAVVRVGL